MQDLLILESPNKIKDVRKYAEQLGLNCEVKATVGHILDLPHMSKGACVDLRTFSPTETVPRDSAGAERIRQLKQAIALADRVIVATDPDREGEAIAAEVWSWIPRGKAFRATFDEITLRGVEAGLKKMRPELHQSAADAAHARRVIDRLAGWNASDVVFQKLRHLSGVSAGRLQSASLRLVVERFRENQGFKSTSTYGVRLKVRSSGDQEFTARLLNPDGTPKVFQSQSEASAFGAPKQIVVSDLETARKENKPRPPFEATSWLQVAQKALGMNVKTATAAIQGLFEQGQTTYPRTDTVRVSEDAIVWAREELKKRFGENYVPPAPWDHKDRGLSQGAHEAIRPTLPHEPTDLEGRKSGEWGPAYALIEARFLASQAAAQIVQNTRARLEVDGMLFEAKGVVELFDGWRRVVATDAEEEPEKNDQKKGEDDENGALPPLEKGQTLGVVGFEVTTNTTKPKPLFSQASLVAELKRLGIGRPSTYPTIVPLLLSRGWVTEQAQPNTKRKKMAADSLSVLVPEQVAFELADFLSKAFPSLVDFRFTAEMEANLDRIESGEATRLKVATVWWERFNAEIVSAKKLQVEAPKRPDLGPCPKCGNEGRAGHLRLIKGEKDGRAYEFAACEVDTKVSTVCGYTAPTENGALIAGLNCPRCSSTLKPVRRRNGGHSWICPACPDNKWFLADKAWRIVKAPSCEKCQQLMVHRERTEHQGEFFWGCFGCKFYLDSDVFGSLYKTRGKNR